MNRMTLATLTLLAALQRGRPEVHAARIDRSMLENDDRVDQIKSWRRDRSQQTPRHHWH
jgi:hypothetical protein